jgi:hypothetical protein
VYHELALSGSFERQLTDGSWLVNVKVVDPTTRRKLGPSACVKSTPTSILPVEKNPW